MHEVSSGNRSTYKSTQERVDFKGLVWEVEAPFDGLLVQVNAIHFLRTVDIWHVHEQSLGTLLCLIVVVFGSVTSDL